MSSGLSHNLVMFALIWALIGSLLFFFVSALGFVEAALLTRAARGRPATRSQTVIGIGFAILLWPLTAKRLWVHRKATGKMLARILGVRP
jgi:hypothetical protein